MSIIPNITQSGPDIKVDWDFLDEISFLSVEVISRDGLSCFYEEFKEGGEKCYVIADSFSVGDYHVILNSYHNNGEVYSSRSDTVAIPPLVLPKVDAIIELFLNNPSIDTLRELIFKYPRALKYAFIKLRGLFHSGSPSIRKEKLIKLLSPFSPLSSQPLRASMNLPCQELFIISLLVYGGSKEWILSNYEALKSYLWRSNIPDNEIFFILGLASYKIGDKTNASNFFYQLSICNNKVALPSHQLSSINYKFPYKATSKVFKKVRDFEVLNAPEFLSNGVVLISCDWGFFSAYHSLAQSKAEYFEFDIHYHLVLPEGFDISVINKDFSGSYGLSYEIEPLNTRKENKNYKTYYSLVRYLVAKDISELYNKKILVSDIDINFDEDVAGIFEIINNNEAALVFSDSGLPWTEILAGFNVFGKEFFATDFYRILCDFIISNYQNKLDYWMLDQIALEIAYENSTRETISRIRSMKQIKKSRISQQSDNKLLKQKARLNIIDAVKNLES